MDVEAFIERWTSREGGAERANYQMFLSELCDVIGVPRPEPAGVERDHNDYVFERAVRRRESDEIASSLRIDLYKRDAFILEAKQSRLPGGKNAVPENQAGLFDGDAEPIGRRTAARGWDVMMQRARKQAENYVFLLESGQPTPPFIIVCDVGNCLELYADFSGTGRGYTQFPDRQGFRIYMEDLHKPGVRALLAKVWTDPHSLDPTKEAARVTREIAKRLAEVSKALEADHAPEEVALFLMRCIFTMFAEDVDLLPKGKFKELLQDCVESPGSFAPLLTELWHRMEQPQHDDRFFSGFRTYVRYFNGNLFKDARAFPLAKEEIGELLAAAKADWKEVDPAIFGTLLEQALDPTERRKLGAHYTPRAYVQRLVDVTVMEPLRADWQAALTQAEDAKQRGDEAAAVRIVRAFHHKLCTTRVLDPACGTGNFLYVSLELMKKLEGEVLETLAKLGESENLGLERETVDPHQFLGLELNPRAAAIAELVVWIGYLQQHYRTRTGHPSEPILKAFDNINFGRREGYDAVLTWDGYPLTKVEVKDGRRVETYPNARRPAWPEAEFIVGNPPFIGNKRMIGHLGSDYVLALRRSWPDVSESADLVMFWWHRAAELARKGGIRRFGLVTTNSITMAYNRAVVEQSLDAKPPLSVLFAIPDHPWVQGDDAADVRIAMTVGCSGLHPGMMQQVKNPRHGFPDSDELGPPQWGQITGFLKPGARLDDARALLSNTGLSFMGVIPVSLNFVVSPAHIEHFGYNLVDPPSIIRKYLGGRALTDNKPPKFIIDFFGLSLDEARREYPRPFQHVLEHVKPFRDTVNRKNHREIWWIFGEARPGMRVALSELRRYIATTETSKHRWFTMLDSSILPDQKIRIIAVADYWLLCCLSSRTHVLWATAVGGRVGKGNDPVYNNTTCFDPFPFPDPPEALKARLRALGEELDSTRKRVQAEHPDLTLTGLYNVLEKLKAGGALTAAEEDVNARGLVLILKELHEQIDRLTAEAYGWPADLSDEEMLERLVALNAERAKEEAAGHVRWLRPDYQIPRFAKGAAAKSGELDLGEKIVTIDKGLPAFPTDAGGQILAVQAALERLDGPTDAATLARGFRRGGKRIERRVAQALDTLALYGRANRLPDGRFMALRAA